MPAKTAAQYGAMAAAAHGKGQLGIPKAVAQEFVRETPASKRSTFAQANAAKKSNRRKLKRRS